MGKRRRRVDQEDRVIAIEAPLTLRNTLNSRMHWAARHRLNRTEAAAVGFLLRGYWDRPNLPVVVRLHRIYGPRNKPMDGDGLQAAFKAIRDAVAEWLRTDDADPGIEWEYSQERGKSNVVRIEIEER